METLHVTNGDCAVDTLRKSGVTEPILPWRDVLHEGPVLASLDLESLSDHRSAYIAEQGWAPEDETRKSFAKRDQQLRDAMARLKIVLWFEDDLYDQLQLLQILDTLHSSSTTAELVAFQGSLGNATTEDIEKAKKQRSSIGPSQLSLAHTAWAAFSSPTPDTWVALIDQDLSALPFLRPTVLRLLEEYPAPPSGLPRIERQALILLADGPLTGRDLFSRYQATEELPFLGDSVFWSRLRNLLRGPTPLICSADKGPAPSEVRDWVFSCTGTGLEVLHGRLSWIAAHSFDRWIGGVHLRPGHLWMWDPAQLILQPA